MSNLINKLKERAATYKQFGIDPTTQELLEKAAEVLGGSCQGTLSSIPPNTYTRIESVEHSEYVQKLAFESGFGWCWIGEGINNTQEPYLYFEHDFVLSYGTDLYTDSVDERGSREILVDMDTGVVTYVD